MRRPPSPSCPRSTRVNTDRSLVNVSTYPLYDIFVIYRDSKRHLMWTRYLAKLPPVPLRQEESSIGVNVVAQFTSLSLPDFAALPSITSLDEKAFTRQTHEHLLEVLTAGSSYPMASEQHDPANPQSSTEMPGLHDPAIPQPPTQMSVLYPDEAAALEAIWHETFFTRTA